MTPAEQLANEQAWSRLMSDMHRAYAEGAEKRIAELEAELAACRGKT